jgi:hypothetical protein
MTDGKQYPRILNGDGCLYGRHVNAELQEFRDSYRKRMCKLEDKLDKVLWALVISAVGFASSAVMLGLNLAIR